MGSQMERLRKQITLNHLVVSEQKTIGIKFYPDNIIQALLKEIPGLLWTNQFNIAVVLNRKKNLDLIFSLFQGIAWINCSRFIPNKPMHGGSDALAVNWYRERTISPDYPPTSESNLDQCEIRKICQ